MYSVFVCAKSSSSIQHAHTYGVPKSATRKELSKNYTYRHDYRRNKQLHTAIPYRASTGPVQGFPCVVFPTRKNLFPSPGNPVIKTGFSLCGKSTQGKPCSGPVLALYGIAVHLFLIHNYSFIFDSNHKWQLHSR